MYRKSFKSSNYPRLISEVAKHTDCPREVLEDLFKGPVASLRGACIPWKGKFNGDTPTMVLHGVKPSFRGVRALICGPQARTLCGNPSCVNPTHIKPAGYREQPVSS